MKACFSHTKCSAGRSVVSPTMQLCHLRYLEPTGSTVGKSGLGAVQVHLRGAPGTETSLPPMSHWPELGLMGP